MLAGRTSYATISDRWMEIRQEIQFTGTMSNHNTLRNRFISSQGSQMTFHVCSKNTVSDNQLISHYQCCKPQFPFVSYIPSGSITTGSPCHSTRAPALTITRGSSSPCLPRCSITASPASPILSASSKPDFRASIVSINPTSPFFSHPTIPHPHAAVSPS